MSINMYKTSWFGQYPVGSGCYPLLCSDWGHWGSRIVNVLKKEKKKQNKQKSKTRKATVPCSCWNSAFPTPWGFVSVFAVGWGRRVMIQGFLS